MTDSSTEEVVDTSPPDGGPVSTTQVSDSTPSQAAASSTENKPAETILDRVKATYQRSTEAAPASSAPGDKAPAADPTKSTAEDGGEREFTSEEMAALAPRTQARMRKLTSDLNAQSKELQKLQPKAAEYDKIDGFIRQNGLQPRDVQSIAEIAAMLVHNPQGAYERLVPIVGELQRILGVALPPDLQQQVEQGYLTPEHAQALARSNATARLATQRANAIAENQRQTEAVGRQQQAVDTSLNAMDAWERQTKAKDPDWHQKQPEVIEQVETAILRKSQELGKPWFPSQQEVNELLAKAYETVNTRFKRFAPRPTSINPPVNSGVSPRSTPQPKNVMDIIRQNVGR